jgi:hypothetical protein
MQFKQLTIPDVICFTPKVFGDDREFFCKISISACLNKLSLSLHLCLSNTITRDPPRACGAVCITKFNSFRES